MRFSLSSRLRRLRHGAATAGVMLILGLEICGCGGGGGGASSVQTSDTARSSTTTTSPTLVIPTPTPSFTGKTYRIGDGTGALDKALEQLMTPGAAYEGQTDGPVVIADSAIEHLSAVQTVGLVGTLGHDHAIVLLKATAVQVNLLLGLLGQPQDYALPAGLPADRQYAEVFAVDLEASGAIYTYECYAPHDDPATPSAPAFTDGPESQQKRAEMFLTWLGQDGSRPLEAAPLVNDSNLRNLASAQVLTKSLSDRGVVYQITYAIWAVHSLNTVDGTDSDWFYVQQNGQFNPVFKKHAWYEDLPHDVGFYYLGSCSMDSWFPYQDNPQGGVTLLKTTPENANGVIKVTSGMSWNFGGKLAYSAKGNTAEVSSGVTISHSESFDVTDCTVTNNSASRQTNAEWRYDLKKAEGIRYIYYAGLADPPALARANFQPVNQWIWRVSPALRDDPNQRGRHFETRFNATLVFSDGGTVSNVPWVGGGPFHREFPREWMFPTPLRYPPLIVSVPNLSYTAAAAFRQLDIGVSTGWTATSDQAWCTVNPTSGPADNTATFVTVEKNTTGADRFATLTFRTADGRAQSTTRVFQSRF